MGSQRKRRSAETEQNESGDDHCNAPSHLTCSFRIRALHLESASKVRSCARGDTDSKGNGSEMQSGASWSVGVEALGLARACRVESSSYPCGTRGDAS